MKDVIGRRGARGLEDGRRRIQRGSLGGVDCVINGRCDELGGPADQAGPTLSLRVVRIKGIAIAALCVVVRAVFCECGIFMAVSPPVARLSQLDFPN